MVKHWKICLAPLDWEFTLAHPGFSSMPGPEGIWLTTCLHPVFGFGTFSQWYSGKIKLCKTLTGNSRHTTRDMLGVSFTRTIILKQVRNPREVRCSCWVDGVTLDDETVFFSFSTWLARGYKIRLICCYWLTSFLSLGSWVVGYNVTVKNLLSFD